MENTRQRSTILKICITAVMAALVFGGSNLQIQIPSIVGFSRFHLGNILCALSGILLGPWWGGLAAGLGSAFFDVVNPAYITEAPITFVTKGLYGLIAGLMFYKVFKRRSNYGTEFVSALCAAVAYIIIYLTKVYFYNSILITGLDASAAWLVVLQKAPSALFNGVVAVIFAPILGVAINNALKSAHLYDRILG